jgi:hypothetical protein
VKKDGIGGPVQRKRNSTRKKERKKERKKDRKPLVPITKSDGLQCRM